MTNPKHTPPVRFGLIGAGGIAQTYAQAFESGAQAKLVAVADTRVDAARALAERAGCSDQCYASYQDMAAHIGPHGSDSLDAVIVCTPPYSHPEICVYFLERRIPVLCEKPLSIDVEDAKHIVDTAHRMDVTFTMASKFRYVEDVVRAKSLVESGVLGDIILFENAFTARVDMASRWNANASLSGGGVLIDNGTHSVDLMRYFLGQLAAVQVIEGKRVQGLEVEDTVRVFARSMSGTMGSIDLSWSMNKEADYYISIYGSHGTVFVGWKESKYRQTSSPEWVTFGHGYNKVQAFQSQIENFARAIHGEEQLVIQAEDALASVQVIETAYAALHNNRWTAVDYASFGIRKAA